MRALARGLQRVHFAVACVLGGFGFVFGSFVALLWLLVSRDKSTPYYFAVGFTGYMRFLLGWRMEVDHPERLTACRPGVYVANHQSNLDIVAQGSLFRDHAVVLGKKEILKIPGFGWFFVASGQLLVDRGNRESALRSMTEAAERMKNEKLAVWIFPEGHRNWKPDFLPFKKGAFRLAIAAQVPVVPIVVEPLHPFLEATRWLVRPGTLRARVLEPFPTEGMTDADVEPLLRRVRGAMETARDELRATARPPI